MQLFLKTLSGSHTSIAAAFFALVFGLSMPETAWSSNGTRDVEVACPSDAVSDIYNAPINRLSPEDFALSMRMAKRALVQLQKSNACPGDALLLYQKLGDFYSNPYNPQKDNDLAERYYKEAYINAGKGVTSTMDQFDAANNLAQFYIRVGRPNYAEPIYRLCDKILTAQIKPSNGVLYAKLLSSVGGAYLTQGYEDYALPWYKKSLAQLENTAGAEPEQTALVLDDVAAAWELHLSTHKNSNYRLPLQTVKATAAKLHQRALKLAPAPG